MKIKTCLRFPGGKFYGSKHILPLCKIAHDSYVESFIGGASIFLGKELAPKLNWLNDLDPELINFYLVIQDKSMRAELFDMTNGEIASKKRHEEVRNMNTTNKIEKAFKFFYLNRTSFSGIMNNPRWGYALGSSVTPDNWTKIIEPVANKLKDVRITNFDFREILKQIKDNNSTLIYLDPPYLKASKAIYNFEFTKQDHLDLLKLLKKTKSKFILSYEDCPEIMAMYNWAKINKINFRYYMSEARRQDGFELIITNFELLQTHLT